jgi:hypothetical protein
MTSQFGDRDETTMSDLETRFPGIKLNVGSPERAHQDEALFVAGEALTPSKSQETGANDAGARLFEHFPAQRLLPRLRALGSAARQAPGIAVVTNQYYFAALGHAHAGRAVA